MGEDKIRLHRDKEATQRSGQLVEEGYYGINRQICAAYALNPDEIGNLFFWENEDIAVRELMMKVVDGWIVAPMIYKNWCQNTPDETDDDIMDEIRIDYSQKWASWMHDKYNHQKTDRGTVCFEFLKQVLTGKDIFLETQLIQYALLLNAISQNQSLALRQQIRWEGYEKSHFLQEEKIMAGFAFQSDAMGWQYVQDAYLPVIYRKRMNCIEKKMAVSPIFLQPCKTMQDKSRFLDSLRESIDQTVLYICLEIVKYAEGDKASQ